VYVFTPRNDIIDLPTGATPIDFAYHIHTEVGHRCRGAKVNGRLVNLDYQLQTSDRVEIITTSRGGPSLDWLNKDLGYVRTQRARQKIREWFRKRDRENNINTGREALERELRRLGIEDYQREIIAEKTNYSSVENLLEAIGYGEVTASSIVARLVELEKREAKSRHNTLTVTQSSIPASSTVDRGVNIAGTSGLLVKLATCCHPAQGDQIVGFITRGNGVAIHRKDCKNVIHTSEPERLIQVDWGEQKLQVYAVPIEILANDRSGLMRDIAGVIAGENISMTNVNVELSDQVAIFSLVMEIQNVMQLSRVLNKLEQISDVFEARRCSSKENNS
jgi:GTP pyrophosphokinase